MGFEPHTLHNIKAIAQNTLNKMVMMVSDRAESPLYEGEDCTVIACIMITSAVIIKMIRISN